MKKKINIIFIIVLAILTTTLLLLSSNPDSYQVVFNPANGEESTIVFVKENKIIQEPETPSRNGYNFVGWYYLNGTQEVKWDFMEDLLTQDVTLTAKWSYGTEELPIININTSGLAIDSKEEYTNMTFSISNCSDELDNVSGGIRIRGNSTSNLAKKPYRIKFDKKQSLFGLEKAKSWVLLAEYLDPSALLNYTALSLGNKLPGLSFTPTPHKVNLYINGEYQGLYTLCEQVQENEGRMNIELDEITSEMDDLKDFNFFISMDRSVLGDETQVEGETYFYLEEYGQYFELKYPEKNQFVTEEQFNKFFKQLKEYVLYIMNAFYNKDIEIIKKEINTNSLIDYLIVDIILGEQDHCWKSFNMYYTNTSTEEENGKLNFGPIWDYDASLNNKFYATPNQQFEFIDKLYYSNLFIRTMSEIPEFYEQVKVRYNTFAKPALKEYIDGYDKLISSMQTSLDINQQMWYSNISNTLTTDNTNFLKEYLEKRKIQLDELWNE